MRDEGRGTAGLVGELSHLCTLATLDVASPRSQRDCQLNLDAGGLCFGFVLFSKLIGRGPRISLDRLEVARLSDARATRSRVQIQLAVASVIFELVPSSTKVKRSPTTAPFFLLSSSIINTPRILRVNHPLQLTQLNQL
jgi:hypothetical protein